MSRLVAALALACAAVAAQAQEWPTRPVRLITGFGAGGGTDILARMIAPALGEVLGQPFVVENRPGAGGTLAAHEVARAAPDGHTAFLLNNGHAVSAAVYKSLPYDAVGDFQPVSMVAKMPLVLLVGPNAPYGTLRALIAEAKHNPGGLRYASVGVGSTQHFACELLLQLTGAAIVHTPRSGTPEVVAAVQEGRAHMLVEVAAAVREPIRTGKLRALAVTSAQRFPGLPDVPTVAESGVPVYDVATWYALVFPGQTPQAIVDRAGRALREALRRDDLQRDLAAAGYVPETSTPESLAAHMRSEIVRWTLVRDRAGIAQR